MLWQECEVSALLSPWPRDRTQVLRCGGKFLYPVCHLAGLCVVSLRQMPNINKSETLCCWELTDAINAPKGVCIVIKGLGTGTNKVVRILAEEPTSYNTQEAI